MDVKILQVDVANDTRIGSGNHHAPAITAIRRIISYFQIGYYPVLLIVQINDAISGSSGSIDDRTRTVAVAIDDDRIAGRSGTFWVELAFPAASGGQENAISGREGGGVDFFQTLPGFGWIDAGVGVRPRCCVNIIVYCRNRLEEEALTTQPDGQEREQVKIPVHIATRAMNQVLHGSSAILAH
ncbi:MAG: hypothetical protein CEE38_05115 [Planctomycetes bacterium B3_Pla]|nr:MAG: hypothetical protein CEE38_05115 [Planctomycetes bacterium B3_Pla]